MKSLLIALALMAAAPSPQVKVTFFTPTVVRVQKAPEASGFHDGSVAVIAKPEDMTYWLNPETLTELYRADRA